MHGQVVIIWCHSENVSNCENGKNLFFNQTSKQVHSSLVRVVRFFFFHRETCAAKDDFMWCDFFFICAVDVIVYASWDIPSFGILWIVCFWLRCYACTYALYIKVEFLYTSLWCHLYNNITSLVINGRKSFFFIYIYMCLLCMYKPYISCIFLYITHDI